MLRFNFAVWSARRLQALGWMLGGAAVVASAASGAPAGAPPLTARSVQDGVLFDGVPLDRAPLAAPLERYQNIRDTRYLAWLSDGQLLAARRQDGGEQVLRLGLPDTDAPVAVTATVAGTLTAAATPAFRNDALAYLRDAGEGTGPSLDLEPLAGGNPQELVPAGAHPSAPVWAHDGRRLAFTARLRAGGTADLYVLDTSGAAAPRLVAAGSATPWQVLAWTSTDRALLVRHALSSLADELLLVDVDTGAARRIDTPPAGVAEGHVAAARMADDARGVYLLSDRGSEHLQLRYLDLYDGSVHGVSPPLAHDIEHFDVAAGGRWFAYSWTENGYGRIAVVDRKAALQYTPAGLPSGGVTALQFDRTGARLAIELAPAVAPRDVYVYTLDTQLTARWTHSPQPDLDPASLVAPQTLRFPTWDRVEGRTRTLTALLHRARGTGPHPVLVMIDEGEAHAQLDLFTQYCVAELGLAVIAPDLRRGEEGALDFGALLTWIGTQPYLQRDHVLVLGRGAGGTLALTVTGLYGDRVRAAIDIDGAASSAQIAPVRRPVLLIRGLESPPLDAASTEQLLWRLRNANVDSWLVAPRDVDGRLGSEAARTVSEQVMVRFLLRQLGS